MRAGDPEVAVGALLEAGGQWGTAGGIQAQPRGPAPHREAPVEMPPDADARPGTGRAARLLGQLQPHGVEAHGVVGGNGSLILLAQDLVEIASVEGDEGGGRIGRGAAEPGVAVPTLPRPAVMPAPTVTQP